MWTRCVALIGPRTRPGQLVASRTRVARDVQARVVVDPVDQAVLEHRIRARDAVRYGQRVPDLARCVRIRDVDRSQAVRVPRGEHEVLEHGRVVVLLRDATTRLAVWLR